MYAIICALLGVAAGGIAGILLGAMIGGFFDNPNAGHMTRGVMAWLGAMLGGPVGAGVGAAGGAFLGRFFDERQEQRLSLIGDPEVVNEFRRRQRKRVLCVFISILSMGGIGGIGLFLQSASVERSARLTVVGIISGLISGWPIYWVLEKKVKRPILLGLCLGGLIGTLGVFCIENQNSLTGAMLVGIPLGGGLGAGTGYVLKRAADLDVIVRKLRNYIRVKFLSWW